MIGTLRYDWPRALPLIGGVLVLVVLIYHQTLWSMIGIWMESDTFSHGFLVFPAVAYLIYQSREQLAAVAPRPSWLGVGALLVSLALWYVADVGSVQVVEQFAFVATLCAATWAVLGWPLVRALWFPMAFAFFAVPFGDFIIPTLMQFTAWFVVEAVELSGIPVFRDGFMLSIPRGDFEVAKACSGIRYLIASLSLGTFYSYISFTSWKKRAAFILLALLLPIAANGIRAYGIVMIAHFSNMQHAVGIDHLIYGWLFFGVLMFVMFWLGGRYADEPLAAPSADARAASGWVSWTLVAVLFTVAALLITAPLMVRRAAAAANAPLAPAALPVSAPAGWSPLLDAAADYTPDFKEADALISRVYSRGSDRITVTVHSYTAGDNELIQQTNTFAMQFGHKIVRDVSMAVDGATRVPQIGRIDMTARGPRRTILYWYQVDERTAVSANVAKLQEWLARVSGQPSRRALVTVSMPTQHSDGLPEPLREFAAVYADTLHGCVADPAGTACAGARP